MSRALLASLLAAALAVAGVVAAIALESEDTGRPVREARTDAWGVLSPAGLERTEVAAARIGRHIYVAGGFEKRTGLTTRVLERYDIRTDSWKRMRSMPVGLNHPVAAAHRGKLYVHGGYKARRDLSSATARLFVYNPRRDLWARLPKSGTPRAAHAAAVIRGRLYVAGGRSETGQLRSLEAYSFKRRRWVRGPDMKGPARDHMTGVAAGGFFYALAGRDLSGPGNFRTAERYDPRKRRWELLPSMSKARGGIASTRVSRGRVVVFGGEESAGTIGEVELYNPARRRWRSLSSMRTPRHGLGGVSLRNRVYAVEGGPRPGFHFSSAIEFLDVP